MSMSNDGLSYWQAESEGIDLLDITIGDLLDRRAEEFPDKEALVYSCYPEYGTELEIRWTYQDYHERANAALIPTTRAKTSWTGLLDWRSPQDEVAL